MIKKHKEKKHNAIFRNASVLRPGGIQTGNHRGKRRRGAALDAAPEKLPSLLHVSSPGNAGDGIRREFF